ncbi:cytochrome P450 [Alteriqipengyuania flavescens]|uniref:cytochrome P450 n=1 Tax=Alteriqipengyuania flavescens TaxID=3053610 RepID=UPI0025B2A058|nr:cytochrome P450 [Alteriqipengyuania flavescens]WJY19739.1 cytochrome P450 [Alteriqipengyuania flavescens]WJY25679.1 cytochrome P450 [Alteriqipengyuania flavescens]
MTPRPSVSPDVARQVVDPAAYAAWDPLLDTFDRLREDTPVAWIEGPEGMHPPFWLVTRYDDVMAVSKDNATFLNNPQTVVFSLTEGIEFARNLTGGSPHMVASLVTFDAPIHMKYRKLTQDWFMPKNLRTIENEVRSLARETVQRLVDAGPEADFVKLVSAPYPLHVVMQILGVPEEDEARMLMLTQQMFGGQDEDLNQSSMTNLTTEQITQLVAGAVQDFEAYFARLTAEKRANPTDDVASTIANAMVDGEPLNDRDMMGYYIIVAAAGHDTTSASTAGAMLALARDPVQFAQVKADRSLLPGIVEEAIRWTSPVQHFMRTAAHDTELGGQKIAAGDWLMLNYVAANHDPAQFDDPRRFDASRKPNRHLAFGAGAHQCLGLHLARLEMRILFETLLDRIDRVELAGGPARAKSSFVGGLKTLPIRFTAS